MAAPIETIHIYSRPDASKLVTTYVNLEKGEHSITTIRLGEQPFRPIGGGPIPDVGTSRIQVRRRGELVAEPVV